MRERLFITSRAQFLFYFNFGQKSPYIHAHIQPYSKFRIQVQELYPFFRQGLQISARLK